MVERNYEGDPVDGSMKSGPWANEGETVDVVGGETPGKGEIDLELPLSEAELAMLKELEGDVAMTNKELAEVADCTREHAHKTMAKMEDANVVVVDEGGGKWGANLNHSKVSVSDLKRRLLDNTSWLPKEIDALVLTETEKKVLEAYRQFPNSDKKRLADMADTTQPTVWRTLDKFSEELDDD